VTHKVCSSVVISSQNKLCYIFYGVVISEVNSSLEVLRPTVPNAGLNHYRPIHVPTDKDDQRSTHTIRDFLDSIREGTLGQVTATSVY